jgi:hypothetical protein
MRVFADKPILVPLTTSLYVPGTLADNENVIVDVGTGFYVEKVGPLLWVEEYEADGYRAQKTQRNSMMPRLRSWETT